MESTIARWNADGWNVAFRKGFVVFDDRWVNAEIIKEARECPERVVLGSSRCMQVRKEFFPQERFLNHAMRRGVLEDMISIWQLYRQKGWKPKRVLIGIDAWLFDATYWKRYWLSLRSAFGELQNDWRLPYLSSSEQWDSDFSSNKCADFCSANYWKRISASCLEWTNQFFFKTHQDGLSEYVRRDDGSVSYHSEFRELPAEQVAEKIKKSTRFPNHQVSENMTTLLRRFLEGLRFDGVEVSFIIPPYHPAFYQLEGKNSLGNQIEGYESYLALLSKVEQTVHSLAETFSLKIYGGFDPIKVGAEEDEFYDWMHPKEGVFKRLLQKEIL
jgi:hypothetical protein